MSAGHRRFIDALRAGLQLRDQFPQHDIKVRPKDKARGIALKIAKLRELLAAGAVGRLIVAEVKQQARQFPRRAPFPCEPDVDDRTAAQVRRFEGRA